MGWGNQVRVTGVFEDRISPGLAKARAQFDSLGKNKGFQAIAQGVGMGAGISAFSLLQSGISTAIDTVSTMVGDASDLNEVISKSGVIFGDSADDMEEWGSTAASSMGISKRAALEAAAGFGNIFVSLDMGTDKASEMSQTMVQLAGDLASFNNIGTDVALEKIRAGLAGEAEPLRALGVFLTEAKVKAKALEMGLVSQGEALSEGDKIMSRYQLILEETATAQGDFARTSDSLANSQRTLSASMEDLSATIGNELLPVVARTAQGFAIIAGAASDASGEADGLSQAFGTFNLTVLRNILPLVDMYAALSQVAEGLEDEAAAAAGAEERERRRLISLIYTEKAAREGAETLEQLYVPSLKDVAKWSGEAEDATNDLADSIAEDLFGDTIRAGEEADLSKTIKELEKDLARTSNKRDAKIIAGQLAEAKKELFLLHLEQAKADGPTAMLEWLKKAERAIGNDDDEMRGLLAHTRAMLDLSGQLPNTVKVVYYDGKGKPGKARGGPVRAGEAYKVGEEGEELFVPDRNGYIVPHDRIAQGSSWAGGGGGGGEVAVPIVITLDGEPIYQAVERRQTRQMRLAATRT